MTAAYSGRGTPTASVARGVAENFFRQTEMSQREVHRADQQVAIIGHLNAEGPWQREFGLSG